MHKSIWIILIAVIVTAINVGLTRFMMNKQQETVLAKLNIPNIAVIDHDVLIEELKLGAQNAAHPQAQVLADRENLLNALRLQNYLVVESHQVLAHSPRFELGNIDMVKIRDYLEKIGAPVANSNDYKAQLEQTGLEIQRLLQATQG